jgi:hypothetical protein
MTWRVGERRMDDGEYDGERRQVVGRDGHLGDATHRANYTLTTFISLTWRALTMLT